MASDLIEADVRELTLCTLVPLAEGKAKRR